MTTNPSATTVERETIEIPEIAQLTTGRAALIGAVLSEALEHDRELRKVGRAVDLRLGATERDGAFGAFPREAMVDHPSRICDAITGMQDRAAHLAAALYPAAARFVGQALDFDPNWTWSIWREERHEKVIETCFRDAGILDDFVSRG